MYINHLKNYNTNIHQGNKVKIVADLAFKLLKFKNKVKMSLYIMRKS